jgi:hypothetical protein
MLDVSGLRHPLPRRVGDAGAVRPPEATYQDEFYRSILEVTGGCVRIPRSIPRQV